MHIHFNLIGSIPVIEHLRNVLPGIISRYEASRPATHVEFGLMSDTEVKEYLQEELQKVASMQRMADAVAIELGAAHFYGLSSLDFSSMDELIGAIKVLNGAANG